LPTGQTKTDEYFGTQEVYHEDLTATVPVARAAGGAIDLPIDVTYQGCADAGLCYPPITRNLRVSLPAGQGSAVVATGGPEGANNGTASSVAGASASGASGGSGAFVSEQEKLAALIRDGNLFMVLATFFGIGVLLSFTPCVLPMIPILSGIIVGQGGKVTAGRGFSLAFTYVQGMALTYAAAGAAFVLLFKQAPQAFFQKPWIVGLFALLFIVLAFAMSVRSRCNYRAPCRRGSPMSNHQKSGTSHRHIHHGCAVRTRRYRVRGARTHRGTRSSARPPDRSRCRRLYATGLGMGVPLLLVGASAGSVLPRLARGWTQ
jgi:thiol:disulfide interchange protein DsbD